MDFNMDLDSNSESSWDVITNSLSLGNVANTKWNQENSYALFLHIHDDVIKWKHFPRTGHLCVEFTGQRWIPRTKASDAELWCFLWSVTLGTRHVCCIETKKNACDVR